jgi:hypothetical protein
MKKMLLIITCFISSLSLLAQDKETTEIKPLTPYIEVLAGGCVENPFSFMIGVQKTLKNQLALSYDIHYWNTRYECYCDDVYSKGHFISFTPSVKITYNTGRKEGNGLMAGIGLGYMFAKDRGTEQTYSYDLQTNKNILADEMTEAKWDFNSIAPSFSLGVGFRVLKLPVSIQSVYYFAKTSDGWMAVAGGMGIKVGLKRYR